MTDLSQKTRRGRLRALDQLLCTLEGPLLDPNGPFADAPVVDLGLGARPWTTVELADVLQVPVVGVDVEPDVVAQASAFARPGLSFLVGGFELPVSGVRLVRALNVLRNYGPEAVAAAHVAMGRSVALGGLVVEGSCGPVGEVGCVHWLRRRPEGLRREALVMWTDGSRGGAPVLFRDRLPRDLRASTGRDHPLGALLQRWMRAFVGIKQKGADPLVLLEASVVALADPDLEVVGPGAVRWRPTGGVPAGARGPSR